MAVCFLCGYAIDYTTAKLQHFMNYANNFLLFSFSPKNKLQFLFFIRLMPKLVGRLQNDTDLSV